MSRWSLIGGVVIVILISGCGNKGMTILAGLMRPASDPTVKDWRTANYALVQEMAGEFKAINGSIVCKELLGLVPMGS